MAVKKKEMNLANGDLENLEVEKNLEVDIALNS